MTLVNPSTTPSISLPAAKMLVFFMLAADGNIQIKNVGNPGNSALSIRLVTSMVKTYYRILDFTATDWWNNGVELITKDSTNTEVIVVTINCIRTNATTGRFDGTSVLNSQLFTIPYLGM